jgi:hypothetical protein
LIPIKNFKKILYFYRTRINLGKTGSPDADDNVIVVQRLEDKVGESGPDCKHKLTLNFRISKETVEVQNGNCLSVCYHVPELDSEEQTPFIVLLFTCTEVTSTTTGHVLYRDTVRFVK